VNTRQVSNSALFAATLVAMAIAAPLRLNADEAANDASSPPSLTIYNQNFAVVRQSIPLSLTSGINQVQYSDISAHVEPDSVVLRDPDGHAGLHVREQNYRGDVVSQEMLLSLYEGKTIDFLVSAPDVSPPVYVKGKIIRSGYVPHSDAYSEYGSQYQYQQQVEASSSTPLIEVNGQLQFSLPGTPVFPALADDSILKPALEWTLTVDNPGPFNAELAYITGGMSWQAAYNIVAPETGSTLDLTGWVTIDNETGKDFDQAHIKLMAGDVNKIQPEADELSAGGGAFTLNEAMETPQVTQKAFDEYHLYSLPNPTTLRDRETKQVEFVRAERVSSREIYIYDGAQIDTQRYGGWGYENVRQYPEYGTDFTTKVAVAREFDNTIANGLGVPLPAGRIRFYRRDSDGQLEFTGENTIDHTPKDETIRVTTGDAFDLVGSRTQTNYKIDTSNRTLDESFSIDLKNHKDSPVTIQVVEHLYRGMTWTIVNPSTDFIKNDAHTVQFNVKVPASGEQTVTYTAHYTW
jgi:hypothetical protein